LVGVLLFDDFMPIEPSANRAIAFIDGQNLFYNAKTAFGYAYPNYNPLALATKICSEYKWSLMETRFYTGLPDQFKDPFWHRFWSAKLASMARQGIKSYTRPLKYRTEQIKLSDGTCEIITTKQEKGIDVRLALDVVRFALDNKYDVGLIFSQDQDLSEVADEIKAISILQNRWIQIASAFPVGAGTINKRGINQTKWITIDQTLYQSCLDHRDYRQPIKRH
jgi:uncharacterized LabA/DUF88 family protein